MKIMKYVSLKQPYAKLLIAGKRGFESHSRRHSLVFIHNLYRFSEIIFPPQESREVK